jgi:hypothetical protein
LPEPRVEGRDALPLVHIGYHKTGTSWLQRHLFRNAEAGFHSSGKGRGTPVTSFVSERALDFDVERARAEFGVALAAARTQNLVPVVSLERLSGHPLSGGYDSRELGERLSAVLPGARILCVFREQTAMIASTYKQYVKTGGPSSIERFLAPPVQRHRRIPMFDFRHFEYDRLLSFYRTLFGPENVLFVPYEGFATDPESFVRRIAAFAGAEPAQDAIRRLPFDRRANVAQSAVATAITRRLNRLFVLADVNPNPVVVAPRLADRLRKATRAADRLPSAVIDRSERRLRNRISSLIAGRYGESNGRVSRLTGLDLLSFGYVVEPSGAPPERTDGPSAASEAGPPAR